MVSSSTPPLENERIAWAQQALRELKKTIHTVYVGQDELVHNVLIGLLSKGNILLEGPPGLGKTLLVSVLANALDLDFSRIQFTPDLMPADITGTVALLRNEEGHSELQFQPGPIFSNVILADEINRATPKTQSAMLEAMQEKSVTVSGQKRHLDKPFFVLATQNPVEMEGTYPLPEAQLDRFLFKLDVPFPSRKVLREIGLRTTGNSMPEVEAVIGKSALITIQELVRNVVVSTELADVAARIILATHPNGEDAPAAVQRFVQWGASPRAMQALLVAGRAEALLDGRPWANVEDVRKVAPHVLRHRMILNFDAKLEKVDADALVQEILNALPAWG